VQHATEMIRPESADTPEPTPREERLGDFTATARMVPIAGLAVGIGAVGAFVALLLLKLIGLFTNLFFFQRWAFTLVSPADNHLGVWSVLVPIIGCLIIGVMARYGSERIRGHGIPEALEAILIRGSRIQPRVALLKPISSAVSIGSGGPFGAEGPIIMTGGAIGSLVAQLFHLTSAERKTLLVAGAAAGMSATFASPVAAVILAVELLLFELKPRSFVPVALASATAAGIRHFTTGAGPLFATPPHPGFVGAVGLMACGVVGLAAGGLSIAMTASVYAAEDFFQRLKIHWMWWPAIGGAVVGLGGLICPQALGVGYDRIESLLSGGMAIRAILLLAIVKWIIWAVALGSGTSGGVLAPLLMMGSALGGLLSPILPHASVGFWPLVAMGAILGGTMRAPMTGIVFSLELTGDLNMLLPLLVAATIAHGVTVLFLRRSILTEKVSRRGYHVSREYAIDALEILFVRDVMQTEVAALPADVTVREATVVLSRLPRANRQRLYPAIDGSDRFVGVVTRGDLERHASAENESLRDAPLQSIVRGRPVVAFPDEPLRVVIHRMADTGLTRMPVVERNNTAALLGKISMHDMLKARVRHLEDERRRERVLPLEMLVPFSWFGLGSRREEPAVDSRRGPDDGRPGF
jgi:CIC family chloride channel protein